ncbi:host cell division inhibitor Icd-like protein [Acerihabitans sp. TG2]|nr:host cell division inhibitor Icd-like protein [Acerihabitans sp. TG2]MEA9393503.1 host cell division inhibitor Icd-like protein [Acerihabitans sp. TG2]
MATSPIISHSAFTFIFAAVRRSVPNSRPCMVRTIATCEHDARQSLARDYVLSFAGRLPVREVA